MAKKESHRQHAFTVKAIMLASQGTDWSATWKPVQIIFPWTHTKFQSLFWSFLTWFVHFDWNEFSLTEFEHSALTVSILFQHRNKNSRKQWGTRSYSLGWYIINSISGIIPQSWGSCFTAGLEIPSGGESHNWTALNFEDKHKIPSNIYTPIAI